MASKRKADAISSSTEALKPNRNGLYTKDSREVINMLKDLGPELVQNILLDAYSAWPEVECMVKEKYAEFVKEKTAKKAREQPLNFDSKSKACWHALNTQNKRLKPSQQYQRVGEVFTVLSENRKDIMKKADKTTRWETRRNALETLRKICKSIMLCDEQVIKHEVMNDGVTLAEFVKDMVTLADGMTERERRRYDDEALLEKLVELRDHCDWETYLPGLRDLLKVFEIGKPPAAAKPLRASKEKVPVIINLDGESDEEVEEDDRIAALKAFDRSRGCICHNSVPQSKGKSGKCPIHKI